MKIKYFGASWEKGLTLTAKVYDLNGQEVGLGHVMTETAINSGVYVSEEVEFPLSRAIYTTIVIDSQGNRLGYNEFAWDGSVEIDLSTVDRKLWTESQQSQANDALGIDGNKKVARNGQLQKKSEGPNNNTIDMQQIDPSDSNQI